MLYEIPLEFFKSFVHKIFGRRDFQTFFDGIKKQAWSLRAPNSTKGDQMSVKYRGAYLIDDFC